MMKTLLPVVAVLALSGCATQTFTMQPGDPLTPTQETNHAFFVDGIGQRKTVDAAAACGGADQVVKVEVEQRPIDVVFSVITFGIYTPRGARVYCAG